MLKSHQRRDFPPAKTKVDYLPFAKVLYGEKKRTHVRTSESAVTT